MDDLESFKYKYHLMAEESLKKLRIQDWIQKIKNNFQQFLLSETKLWCN